jgi:tRNA nucleotidyltransferase (CCA-adding enzyme)
MNISQRFTKPVHDFLHAVGKAGDDFETKLFLVGGMVRDVLLGVDSIDVDIMIEGEVEEFIDFIQASWAKYFIGIAAPSSKVLFPKYRTGKLLFDKEIIPKLLVIDFSGARRETYPSPGAAPIVTVGDLQSDLQRRDFSVNALAVSLNKQTFGDVVDFFEGIKHISLLELHVLHKASFRDDPARLLRGARLIARHGFSYAKDTEQDTEQLSLQAISERYIDTLPRERLFEEFKKAMLQEEYEKVLLTLFKQGLLEGIEPNFKFRESILSDYARVLSHDCLSKTEFSRIMIIMAILLEELADDDYMKVLKGFKIGRRERALYMSARSFCKKHYAH